MLELVMLMLIFVLNVLVIGVRKVVWVFYFVLFVVWFMLIDRV